MVALIVRDMPVFVDTNPLIPNRHVHVHVLVHILEVTVFKM